ncbi:cellobiose dehydrogenase [Stachybotrys elegans]|uniref:Cellobiose dehydrogenase n=1 Tax=Stachybotrys elegans TaxID=80388 RepID=A0A8K0SFL1_9HYPO|nr:cellobiose dehydrogenase [Stachybotrys elegans]
MRFSHIAAGLGWAVTTTSAASNCGRDVYDYIVVGGGPSGIITAERLSAANHKVLLLERGHGPTVATGSNYTLPWNDTLTPIDVPALSSAVNTLPLWNEYFCSDTPASACVLGGGTTINYMVFVHPPAHDFENWPKGWNWEDIAPAAQRLYDRNPGSTLPSEDGQRYDQGLYSLLSNLFGNLGWKSIDMIDQPDEKHEVYSYPAWNIKDALRAGPVRTYLPLALERDNFTLRTGAKVIRLIREGSRVTGVEYESSGRRQIVKLAAKGRVVLSSGSLSTPRILFHSGIGPAAQIQTAKDSGVEVPPEEDWINLPVGQNLKDHPIFPIIVKSNQTWGPLNTASVLNSSDEKNIGLYESQGSGVLTQGRHRLIYFTSREGQDGTTRYFQGSCAASGKGVFTVTSYLTHGLTSTGVLGLDKDGKTVIEQSPYLQTEADIEASTSFVQNMIDIFTAPGTGLAMNTTTNATAILKSRTNGNHFVGTTKLGTDDGRMGGTSVVDLNAKVYGTDNLFVTDAGIHPDLPTGNTQAIVMVVAEAAVAKILAYKD